MAADSAVVVKSYAETVGATTFAYNVRSQKVYVEIPTAKVFPYQLSAAKMYVEIVAIGVFPPAVVPMRRMVSASIVQG